MTKLAQDGLPPISEVIRELQLSARKSLGQNFILDLNLTRRIARAAPNLQKSTVIEVGPGPGGLTRALLTEGAAKVIAIEKDTRCLIALEAIAAHYPDRLAIYNEDALDFEYNSVIDGNAQRPTQIVANLPYSVGTALLINWLKTRPWPPWFSSLTLMFQKEVAERIVAPVGTKHYGRLSVLTQVRADARILFHLPARAFTPPPKVDSSLIQIVPHQENKYDVKLEDLERLTMAAFGQRRKMLRQSLKSLFKNPVDVLEAVSINPSLRPEQLDVEGFCCLAKYLSTL